MHENVFNPIQSAANLLDMSSSEFILKNTTVDDLTEFLSHQIDKPFNGGTVNYFKTLRDLGLNAADLDAVIIDLFRDIENTYPNLVFNLDNYDQTLVDLFNCSYKFLIKNIDKFMYKFLREYILYNRNRKNILLPFSNIKISNYPKEQYGCKENYLLMTKLNKIVKNIVEDELELSTFIDFVKRNDPDPPGYVKRLSNYIKREVIIDNGVVVDIFEKFFESNSYPTTLAKLQTDITEYVITPYLIKNGMTGIKMAKITQHKEEDDDEFD